MQMRGVQVLTHLLNEKLSNENEPGIQMEMTLRFQWPLSFKQ